VPQDDLLNSDEGFREVRKQRRIKFFAEVIRYYSGASITYSSALKI